MALLLDNMLLTVVGECSQQPRSMVHGLWSHGPGQGHMVRMDVRDVKESWSEPRLMMVSVIHPVSDCGSVRHSSAACR